MAMALKKHLPIAGLGLALIGVQLITAATGSDYYLTQLTMTAYLGLLIIGLCLVMGYAGQISLGHAGFFGIGGYTSAALTTVNLSNALASGQPVVRTLDSLGILVHGQNIYGETLLYIHPWVACLAAIIATTVIAFAIGIPVLKLKGHYLAMATLGFGIIIYRIVLAVEIFGEADGISDVPPFPLIANIAITGDIDQRVANYYISAIVLIIGMILLQNLIHSRVGRALTAIHGAEDAADAMGVNTAKYKLYTFVVSAVFASLAGVLLTHYTGGISPSDAGVMKSIRFVAIVAIGGMASLWGALSIGLILNFMSLRGLFGSYDDAVFGTILIIIMLFAPDGILRLPFLQKLMDRRGDKS
jgi:branched-chain amino acid transport system permease protein